MLLAPFVGLRLPGASFTALGRSSTLLRSRFLSTTLSTSAAALSTSPLESSTSHELRASQSALSTTEPYDTHFHLITTPNATLKHNQKALAQLFKGPQSVSYISSKLSQISYSALYGFGLVHLDAPEPWQYGVQDGASVTMEGISELHNSVMYFITAIMVGVVYMLAAVIFRFRIRKNPIASKYLNHGTLVELIWTITPAMVLVAIAFPSFRLLYLMDEVISPALTIKIMGHQWYWSYEYCDFLASDEEEEDM